MFEWSSLKEFFDNIRNENYLIIRNFETIDEDVQHGEDIDILCENKEDFVEKVHGKPLNNCEDCYNYYVMIHGEKLLLDIREVGDNYYDKKWEQVMLNSKVSNGKFFTMDTENYKYSLLYHILIQKQEIPHKYIKKISDLFDENEINLSWMFKQMTSFMKKNGFGYKMPRDKGVYFNRKNYIKLKILRIFD